MIITRKSEIISISLFGNISQKGVIMKISKAVAIRIKSLLKEKGMTSYKLSQTSFIPSATLSNIMTEKHDGITLTNLYKLAYGFNMSVVEFLDDKVFADTEILKELI